MSVTSFRAKYPTAAISRPEQGIWHVDLYGDLPVDGQLNHLRHRNFFNAHQACYWLDYLEKSRGFLVVFAPETEVLRHYVDDYRRANFGGGA